MKAGRPRTRIRTGIVESKTDDLQPYRVWRNNKIIWFAKTQEEAEAKLEEAEGIWHN